MSTLEIVPAGDAVEVSWPQGKGAVQAPKPPQCADYVVLKGATNNHLTSDLFK